MKKILFFSIVFAVLSSRYFSNTEHALTEKTNWEQTLDSLATKEVEEMFLQLGTYFDLTQRKEVSKIYVNENSFKSITFKILPWSNWGMCVDTRTCNQQYNCSECNLGKCFQSEIRVRWHDRKPYIRLKQDYKEHLRFLNSCEEGRYYRLSYSGFCLEILNRARIINGILFYECDECNVSL